MGTNQIYKLFHSKRNQNQNRKDWEKIFASYATSKYLISKIHKQLIKRNNKKNQTTQSKTGHKKIFLQRRHSDGWQAHEKMIDITNY